MRCPPLPEAREGWEAPEPPKATPPLVTACLRPNFWTVAAARFTSAWRCGVRIVEG